MARTRSMGKENQTPTPKTEPRTESRSKSRMDNLLAELVTKAQNFEKVAEVKIQKRKIPKMKIPRVRLRNANERILAPAPEQIPTPWDIIRAQIESGEGRAHLRPVVIVIDDD